MFETSSSHFTQLSTDCRVLFTLNNSVQTFWVNWIRTLILSPQTDPCEFIFLLIKYCLK